MEKNSSLNEIRGSNIENRSAVRSSNISASIGDIDRMVNQIPTSNGPVKSSNISEMSPEDINKFFPKKTPVKSEAITPNDDIFADLDRALDRTKAEMGSQMDAILDKRDAEIEEKESAETYKDIDDMVSDSVSNEDFNFSDSDDIATDNETASSDEYDYQEPIKQPHINTDISHDAENVVTNTAVDHGNTINEDNTYLPKTIAYNPNVNDETASVEATKSSNEPKTPVHVPEKKIDTNILDGVNNSSLFDDDDDNTDDEYDIDDTAEKSEEETIKELKSELETKLVIKSKFDLSKFAIANKSITSEKANMIIANKTVAVPNVADWMMYGAEKAISVSGLSGPEILKLNPANSTRNRLNTFKDIYRIIYDHIIDKSKPNYETWLKTTRFSDLAHIYFALYKATFANSNFITYECPNSKCKKMFIKEVNFDDMVSYASDEVKHNVEIFCKKDTNAPAKDFGESELFQISDNYAVALRHPSIWNVTIEVAALSDKFLEKYADMIDLISYIDNIYFIDSDHQMLVPINTKPVTNDLAKTSARRIATYIDNIINKFTSDEFFNLRGKVNEFDENNNAVTYKIPGATCPDCAEQIAETANIAPENLLFTRHQLAAIQSM